MVSERAATYGAYVAYVNLVGGQDELVFDGNSVVFGPRGEVLAHAASFVEELLVCDVDIEAARRVRPVEKIRYEAEGAERLELIVSEVPLGRPGAGTRSVLAPNFATPLD